MSTSREPVWLVHSVTGWSRAAGILLIAAIALSLGLIRPAHAEVSIGIAAVLFALLRLTGPNGPIASGVILLLVVDYVLATGSLAHPSRVVLSVAVALGLFLYHSMVALEAVIPPRVLVDRGVLWRFGARTALYSGLGVASTALTTLVSTGGPNWKWLSLAGVLAALTLAASPFVSFRQRSVAE